MHIPQNNKRFYWTKHALRKMAFYHLSENKVKGVIRKPDRKEEGIAVNTIAVMQKVMSTKKQTEIWVMYQKIKSKPEEREKEIMHSKEQHLFFDTFQIKIISTWRYPGISSLHQKVPIPLDIIEECGIVMFS